METPDKIYVTPIGTWDMEHIPDLQDNIYIRKNALLEWTKEKKERLGRMFDAMPETAIGAKLDACQEFIDKIESL